MRRRDGSGPARVVFAVAVAVVATAGLGLQGCTGSGRQSLKTYDNRFDPAVVKATAGEAVTVSLKNEGGAQHNFSIISLNISRDVNPEGSATVTFTPTQKGTLPFFYKFHGGQGMVGTITVS